MAKKKSVLKQTEEPREHHWEFPQEQIPGDESQEFPLQGARGYNTLPDSTFRKRWNIQLGGDSWMGTASVGWMIPVGWELPALRPHPRESAEFWVLRVASGSSDSVGNSMFCVCSPPELLDPSVSLWY